MHHDSDKKAGCSMSGCGGSLHWWAILVVAVLAVPAFGIIVASVLPVDDMMEVAVFIIACWVCTYLGMKLMNNPNITGKK